MYKLQEAVIIYITAGYLVLWNEQRPSHETCWVAKQAGGAWLEKNKRHLPIAFVFAAASDSLVKGYIVVKSCSAMTPSTHVNPKEKFECSFLLRLKRLHVELVSWIPA